jgi:hypothetical protein
MQTLGLTTSEPAPAQTQPETISAAAAVNQLISMALAELANNADMKMRAALAMGQPILATSLAKMTEADAERIVQFVHRLSFELEEKTGIYNEFFDFGGEGA